MTEKFPYETPPESRLLYQDTSTDGSLTITVWLDNEPLSNLMTNFGAMATVMVNHTHSGELYHEERMALSRSSVFGPGPTEEEVVRWNKIITLFIDE